ncbi:hypothetical protein [Paraflavitalea speifideaquila]|uniref:hypothetical protein n=1 Tax=Paraflavitalea speifideaquila TaxID=3076558 RepID=UPI0028E793D5|nr:hypothetical protein [Paraflavitalea speifideiaquila]
MKKLVLPIVLVSGILCLVSGKLSPPGRGYPCTGPLQEKEILLPVERLMWALDAP